MRRVLATCLVLAGAAAFGGADNSCDEGDFPDVIVGDIHETASYPPQGGITAFSLGTWSCNVGTCELSWSAADNRHPVIAQSLYRYAGGRFEQIGIGWLKHGFFALSNSLCETGCLPTDGTTLGVNCADPYTANRNGMQSNLGPRFEVDPASGSFPYPFSNPAGATGSSVFKRIQVRLDDLDPALFPGARYFVEAQYVAADDALAGRNDNNASSREVEAFGSGFVTLAPLGPTFRTFPAIRLWPLIDAQAEVTTVDVGPEDGIFHVGSRVTDREDGTWEYEYALFNLNSRRAAAGIRFELASNAVVSSTGFHDVDYHSGEPQDGTDWEVTADATTLRFGLPAEAAGEPTANALRWGTLYNVRFVVDRPPVNGRATLELFEAGTPAEIDVTTRVPDPACQLVTINPGGEVPGCPSVPLLLEAQLLGETDAPEVRWFVDGAELPGRAGALLEATPELGSSFDVVVSSATCPEPVSPPEPTEILWEAAPAFAGIAGAEDTGGSPCTVELAWNPAASSCPDPILFDVYRDRVTPVPLLPSRRIAEGLRETTYTDGLGLLSGVPHHYRVVARGSAGSTDGNSELAATPTGPAGECRTEVPGVPPAPDGSKETAPLRVARDSLGGLELTWDSTSCPASDYFVVYGPLASVSTQATAGAVCDAGTAGHHLWRDPAPGDLFLLVVGTDGQVTESSWGVGADGERRPAASGSCGTLFKDVRASCPE